MIKVVKNNVRVLNWGFGTNSTALAVEATNRGIIFDLIVAADTGDEMPHSYDYIETFSKWLKKHGQPQPTIVRWIRQIGDLKGQFIPISELSLSLVESCPARRTDSQDARRNGSSSL